DMVGDRQDGAATAAPSDKKLGKITSTKVGSIYPTLTASSVCGQVVRRHLPPRGLPKIGPLVCHAPNTAQNRLLHRHRVKPPWRTSPTSARC
ncbi:hypothetical protein ACVBGC_32750, partial [Burkholderia stagnalis]